MPDWTRPSSSEYPCKYGTFKGRKEINGKIPTFWVQDLTEEYVEPVVNYMVDEFLKSEPICTYSNFTADKISVEEIRGEWTYILRNHRVGLICFTEGEDGKPVIAGMNCTMVSSHNYPESEFKGKKWLKVLDTLEAVAKVKDAYEAFGVTEYLSAYGLYVPEAFRGQGIGQEVLKARIPLCKNVGLKLTTTVFSATASQILAARVGFKEMYSITYEDLEKQYPHLRYPGIAEHTKAIKYMCLEIE